MPNHFDITFFVEVTDRSNVCVVYYTGSKWYHSSIPTTVLNHAGTSGLSVLQLAHAEPTGRFRISSVSLMCAAP